MRLLRHSLSFTSSLFTTNLGLNSRRCILPSHVCRSYNRTSTTATTSVTMSETTSPSVPLPTTTTESDVISALSTVRERVDKSCKQNNRQSSVQLVAVSKTKPTNLLEAAYSTGQRHFGENYVQELVSKHSQLPSDIKWHYIGPLQSNKAKLLVSVPNLHVVETVDREKTAAALDKACVSVGREQLLNVMVQVNTSGEDSKSGCQPGEETVRLAEAVHGMSKLRLVGLMTIGAPDDSDEPDAFKILVREKERVAEAVGYDAADLKLSMGMSGDFEAAIRMGSDSIRVGSTIFGARDYSKK